MTTSVSPFSHVITQFVDESSFLWTLYESALTAPQYTIQKIRSLKERLEAQLDGLRSCEADGWNAVQERVAEQPATGELFTAAVLAIGSDDGNRLETVVQAMIKPCHALELASALAWFPFDKTKTLCDRFLASADPLLQLAGLTAYTFFRQSTLTHLDAALHSPDPLLRCCALKMIGVINLPEKISIAREHFNDEDPDCAFRAAWSNALLGDITSRQALLKCVDKKFPFADEAAMVVVRRAGLPDGAAIINEFANSPVRMRWALIGIGALGDVSRVPLLIDSMKDTAFSRVAGEALSMITGIDITKSRLDADEPEGFGETPNDDPEDERVDIDADHFLSWPDVQKVSAWWEEHATDFSPGIRYLCGKPITPESLDEILLNGYQRQRYAAAIELMSFKPGEPLAGIGAGGVPTSA